MAYHLFDTVQVLQQLHHRGMRGLLTINNILSLVVVST